MIKILIATPSHRGEPLFGYRESMKKAVSYMMLQNEKQYNLMRHEEVGSSVATNRNKCVALALAQNSDYIMFIDDDISFEPSNIEDLIKHDVDIVSGLYVTKMPPHEPSAYIFGLDKYHPIELNQKPPMFLEVDGCGAGFLLIKTKVFEDIEPPYFSFVPENGEVLSEDLYFCRKAKAAGYDIYVDTSMFIGHIGTYAYTADDYFKYKGGAKD